MPKEFTKEDATNELKNINYLKTGDIVELSLEKYVNLPECIHNSLKLYRTSVDFREQKFNIDPYLIGYWLGEETPDPTYNTAEDRNVTDYFNSHCMERNYIPDIYKYNSRDI